MNLKDEYYLKKYSRVLSPKYGIFRAMIRQFVTPGTSAPVLLYLSEGAKNLIGGRNSFHCGAGLNYFSSSLTAFGEAFERSSLVFSPAFSHRIEFTKNFEELKKEGKKPVQTNEHERHNKSDDPLALPCYNKFNEKVTTDWIDGYNLLNGEKALLPLSLVFLTNLTASSSNGAGCGPTPEMAILNGLLELIERDAFCFAWWTKTSLEQIDFLSSSNSEVIKAAALFNENIDKVKICVLKTDTGIPVFLSFYIGSENEKFRIGCNASAKLNPHKAVAKCLLELAHSMTWSELNVPVKKFNFPNLPGLEIGSHIDSIDYYSQYGKAADISWIFSNHLKKIDTFENLEKADEKSSLLFVLDKMKQAQLDCYAVDISLRDALQVGLHTYKIVAPGLIALNSVHKHRHWGSERLLSLGKKLGLKNTILTMNDLNQMPHPLP